LVLYAFNNAKPGDMFVQKAPACTMGDLTQALIELFKTDTEIKIIGTRHGEKRCESLLTREEMAVAEDYRKYYRIPADVRGLDYSLYYDEGKNTVPEEEYNSDNTTRLDVNQVKDLLLKIPEICTELEDFKR